MKIKLKKNFMKRNIIILSLLIFISCKKEPLTKEVNWEYKYEVSGSAVDYSVTIQNTDNNTQQWSSVGSGWWYKWNQKLTVDKENKPIEGQTRWLYLSAQNNTANGDVTVKIYRNGEIVAKNTSYGAYTIATVDGNY